MKRNLLKKVYLYKCKYPCICFDIHKLKIFTASKDCGKPLLSEALFGGQVAPKMRGNFSVYTHRLK